MLGPLTSVILRVRTYFTSTPCTQCSVLNGKFCPGMLTGMHTILLASATARGAVAVQRWAQPHVGHEAKMATDIQAYELGGQGTEEYRHPLKSTALALRGSRYRVLRTR